MASPWDIIRAIPDPEGYLHWHLDKIVEFIKLLKVAGLNLPYWCMTDWLAEACRENGIFFSVWTVNDPDKIERCIRLGAGNITTRAVRAALDTRDRMLSLPAERS
jgi:glycerophosphoryl diester phosphodiesterase